MSSVNAIHVIVVGDMMNYNKKTLVYIAGPFSGEQNENTRKAIEVGKLATRLGYAPFVPHTTILSGAYGDDTIQKERENGIDITLSILANVCNSKNSELWIISREDSTLSIGTRLELKLWKEIRGYDNENLKVIIKPYSLWMK